MSIATLPPPRTTVRVTAPADSSLDHRHPLVIGGTVIGLGLLWLQIWLVGVSVVLWVVTGWSPTVITGGSMAPTLPPGQLVLVDDSRVADITVGDIVVFDHPGDDGQLVTHRVEEIDASGAITTHGDANAQADSTPVTDDRLHGRVRVVVPFVGLPRVWLARGQYVPFGLFCLLDVVLFIACGRVMRGERRRETDDARPDPPAQRSPWGPPTGPPLVAGVR